MPMEASPQPCFPIIVGISGHRAIAPEALTGVRSSLHDTLQALQSRFHADLHLATGLAEGADQLAAEVAAELGIPHLAVLPMPKADFTKTIDTTEGREKLEHHWALSSLRLELPLVLPGDPNTDKLQYEQLGAVMSRFSHIVIALWDGTPWPADDPAQAQARQDGRGGTGHVVYMRQHGEFHAAGFRLSRLFRDASSRLDLASGGPVLHILTPRAGRAPPAGVAGAISLAGGAEYPSPEAAVESVVGSVGSKFNHPFAEIATLNADERRFKRYYQGILTAQIEFLGVGDAAATDHDVATELAYLCKRQAAADTAAQYHQRRLLGDAPATATLRQRLYHVPGVVTFYPLLLAFAVACFEIYAHLNKNPAWIAANLCILLGIYQFHERVVVKGEWQNRFQDYRALAEAMRVQIFWALAGIPNAVADYYMRKQQDELGWISFTLRGPALWAIAVALKSHQENWRPIIRKSWLLNQKLYFIGSDGSSGKARINHDAHYHYLARRDQCLKVATALTVLLLIAACLPFFPKLGSHLPDALGELLRNLLLVLIVIFLTIGASIHFIADKYSYEGHAQSFKAMGSLFDRALQEADKLATPEEIEAYQHLLKDLGREALAENADWLEDHRHREVTPEHG